MAENVEVVKPASLIASTKTVTESAVSSMLNVIRATFKQTEKETVAGVPVENRRSSSASRGRGLKNNKPN